MEALTPTLERLKKLFSKLHESARRLLLQGLAVLVETRDPAMLYHVTSSIGVYGEYYDEPSPRWPGFFKEYGGPEIELPRPLQASGVDVLKAIASRRSRREYTGPLSLRELSTILYYSVGITGWETGWPLRAYPSAGALQPLEAYVAASHVEELEPGLYHYNPRHHTLVMLRRGDIMEDLQHACLGQEYVGEAPAAIIYTALYARTASKYGTRGYRYIHLDAGTAIENTYLVAEALGLATVVIGAFYDDMLCKLLDIDCRWELPVAVMPIGKRVS